jgi:hypothetical protein
MAAPGSNVFRKLRGWKFALCLVACGPGTGWAEGPPPPGVAREFEHRWAGRPRRDLPAGKCRTAETSTGVTEIAIERTACYGKCPIYWLRMRADGGVEMYGRAHVSRLGHHHGKLHPQLFQELAAIALELGYFGLRDDYSCEVTDSPTVYTSVTRGHEKKLIRHYAPGMAGPRLLKVFEGLIDD